MTINITGRKTTIKDSFREEAEREMARFDRLFDDDASAHITVSNEGGRETVEITIRSGGMIFRAEKTTEDRRQSLARLFDDDASAHITVSNEGGRETVEITIRSGGMIFRAEKTTEDRRQSLAQAGDLLFRQIVKNKSKLADRFKKRAPEIYAEPEAEEPDYSVIKRKHFALKPMHVDEAILQMELLGHNFYMFLNAETEIVIKRKHFALKPMHVDEAILQMELLGHNFYMFLNAETEISNVVYKRNAGGYGLLEPDEN